MLRAALLVAMVAMAGCERKADPAPAATPPAADAGQASAARPTPALPAGAYDAISNTAMSITGELTLQSDSLAFGQGQRYRVTGEALAQGSDPFASSGGSWSTLMSAPVDGRVMIFRVLDQQEGPAGGGICGDDAATFLVLHEGADSGGAPTLFLSAFKGAQPPGPAAAETDLCGTFMYAPKAADVTSTQK